AFDFCNGTTGARGIGKIAREPILEIGGDAPAAREELLCDPEPSLRMNNREIGLHIQRVLKAATRMKAEKVGGAFSESGVERTCDAAARANCEVAKFSCARHGTKIE